MAYDLELAERLRAALDHVPEVVERKMFGGLAFLIRGNMAVVASSKGGLMIRADPATADGLVETTPADYAEMRGRQIRGWLSSMQLQSNPSLSSTPGSNERSTTRRPCRQSADQSNRPVGAGHGR